jgi:hypothetical protein
MRNHTVTSIVRNASEKALIRAFTTNTPDEIYDLDLSPHLRSSSVGRIDCAAGERFHGDLASSLSGKWIDRQYWSYTRVLRDWLKDIGVTKIWSEWEFRGHRRVVGCCDLLVKGGPNARGVVEVKLVNRLPEEPPSDDQFQLGLYTHNAAARFHDYDSYWGALAYVHPRSGSIRVFEWRTMNRCCHAARRILGPA